MNRRRLRLMRLGLARLIVGQPILPFVDGDGTWLVTRWGDAVVVMATEDARVSTKLVRTGDPMRPFRRVTSFRGRLR